MANYLDDNIDFTQYLRETDNQTNVKNASLYIPAIKKQMRDSSKERKVWMPWEKANDSFYFRPGEVTVWAGMNGHGKSQVTAQIAMHLLKQQEKVCMASFEMKPAQTIRLMSRMYIGTNPFTPEYQNDEGYEVLDLLLDKFAAWSKNLWIYDQTGTTNVETVIGMTRYCAKELKINHIFIDSLMKVVGSEEDMTGQKMLVAELFSIAKDHNVHVHLIHHVRKPQNENVIPDKYDLKGSGSISDQVDNVFTVFRNKAKEDDIRNNGKFGTKAAEFDSILKCCKQRHYEGSGDGEPAISLWLHRDSGQFIGQPHDPVFAYE